MRNFKLSATLITMMLLFSVSFFSCKTDKCKQVTCAYSGVCKEGVCLCQIGYEGEHCETVTRDKFKGIFNVNEDGTISGVAQYSLSIENGEKINEVTIKNLQNVYKDFKVRGVTYLDTLTIPNQMLPDSSVVEGWGYIVDTNPLNQHYYQHAILTVYYTVTDKLGVANEYGSNGSQPSVWSKGL
ncbi:MAG: hypothetical protein IT215_01425 [Chitinophagaceae bacterium]|nr:MAG: hypothetical protein UZ11_BCD004000297 [Bacteroidetes bacterium OLB11]MCC6447330.1 hypothetical protein [Chitinophagaceae bacterium]HMN32193.1 hypothetical protein [Chitinophagaceae bacterium]